MPRAASKEKSAVERLMAKRKGAKLDIGGDTWTLVEPPVYKVLPISAEWRRKTGEDGAEEAVVGWDAFLKIVCLCVQDIETEDQADMLLKVAGGFESELMKECLRLCGMEGTGAAGDKPAPEVVGDVPFKSQVA